MSDRPNKSALDAASSRLRAVALASADGEFIGSEESMLQMLGFSRSTIRQAARLLEQQGLLRVKRGIGGGYYATRPDARTIERAVSTYLETVDFDPEDVTTIASALWVEAVRKAAASDRESARDMADRIRKRVLSLKTGATFADARVVERESQKAVIAQARSAYIELIFEINILFASQSFPSHDLPADNPEHLAFIKAWREAKLLEMGAIADGNVELASIAARHVRSVWHKRIWTTKGESKASSPKGVLQA